MKSLRELKEIILNDIPIENVIAMRIAPVGKEFKCPFHDDKHIGSFKIDRRRNVYKCFTCNSYGDAINFIMNYDHTSFEQSVVTIASAFNLINEEELMQMEKAFNVKRSTVKATYQQLQKNEAPTFTKASDSIINTIYEKMIECYPLTDVHRKQLYDRGLNDSQITAYRYFSFTKKSVINEIINSCMLWHIDINVLLTIPGFYKENGKIQMMLYSGIGIPLCNIDGEIVALQCRNDSAKEGQSRYIFYSSVKKGGVSCGSPLSIVYPSYYVKIKNEMSMWSGSDNRTIIQNVRKSNSVAMINVFITEGQFKAATLCKKFNAITITVQGVNSIKGIAETLNEIHKAFGTFNLFIAFDADMMFNGKVAMAILRLCKEVERFKPSLLLWAYSDGKGVDDYFNNPNAEYLLTITDPYKYINALNKMHTHVPLKKDCDEATKKKWMELFFKKFPLLRKKSG